MKVEELIKLLDNPEIKIYTFPNEDGKVYNTEEVDEDLLDKDISYIWSENSTIQDCGGLICISTYKTGLFS